MINEIFNTDFEKMALEKALELSDMNGNVIRLTKKLNNVYIDSLEKYFEEESKLIGF